jgi:hypothetical protein
MLTKLEFSQQVFEKYSNIKFHENPSIGSRAVPCERTDRQTDMTKLTVASRNFAKAPNKTKQKQKINKRQDNNKKHFN